MPQRGSSRTADRVRGRNNKAARLCILRHPTKLPLQLRELRRTDANFMLKTEAIALFESQADLADALGVSPSAISKWPDELTDRQANEVIGACASRGIEVGPGIAQIRNQSACTYFKAQATDRLDGATPEDWDNIARVMIAWWYKRVITR